MSAKPDAGSAGAPTLSADETVRRLAIGDRRLLGAIADLDQTPAPVLRLDHRTEALVHLAVLVALDAPESCYQGHAESALLAGASVDDLVATLIAVAGLVGAPRIVAAAPRIARAAGYDVDRALEERWSAGSDR